MRLEAVDSNIYDADYYLKDGYGGDINRFIGSLDKPSPLVDYPIEVANLRKGERVLDVGCGIGRLLYACAKIGCIVEGYDYSQDALDIAGKAIDTLPQDLKKNTRLKKDDVKNIPDVKKYDVIFMCDIVEHLYDWELKLLFNKLKELLQPNTGRLIIHTAPNRWYINFIFPLKRILNLPKTLKKKKGIFYKRSKYFYDESMHVNEQTPFSLRRHLKGFYAKVWCQDGSSNLISILTKKLCGCDIWAVARVKKPKISNPAG
ncbi:MAG: class I SAM-dependent methyltransferase [Candidatus Omnitrophota bacterium]|nr:MAG: class I SAM-dependent methyltransferase [Candidatus Omnitrophota bacterium]